jgi:muconolactone delta-isomerase
VRILNLMPADFLLAEHDRLPALEQERSKSLSESGKLVAHWKVPLKGEAVTLWEVSSSAELH